MHKEGCDCPDCDFRGGTRYRPPETAEDWKQHYLELEKRFIKLVDSMVDFKNSCLQPLIIPRVCPNCGHKFEINLPEK